MCFLFTTVGLSSYCCFYRCSCYCFCEHCCCCMRSFPYHNIHTHTHTCTWGRAHALCLICSLSACLCSCTRVCVYMLSFAGRLTVWFHAFVVVLTFACFYTHCVLHVYPYKRRRRRQCALRCALRSHLLFVWHLFWESRVRESVLCLCRSLSLTRSHLPYFVIRFHFVFIHIRLARCFTHYASRHFSGSTSSRGLLLPPGCSRRCCCCAAVNLRSCLRSFFFCSCLFFFVHVSYFCIVWPRRATTFMQRPLS